MEERQSLKIYKEWRKEMEGQESRLIHDNRELDLIQR